MQIYETMPISVIACYADSQAMYTKRIRTIPPQIQTMTGSFFHAPLFRIFIFTFYTGKSRWNDIRSTQYTNKAAKRV